MRMISMLLALLVTTSAYAQSPLVTAPLVEATHSPPPSEDASGGKTPEPSTSSANVPPFLREPGAARPELVTRPITLQEKLLLHEQWVRRTESERSRIRLGGPITGLVIGSVLTTGWVAAFATSDSPRPVAALTFSALIVAPIVIGSIVVLTKRVKKRRGIAREIDEHSILLPTSLRF